MKYALVTGGSRGIGRAVSIKLASMGYSVIVNYVSNEAKALETIAAIKGNGGSAEPLKFDVGNAEETESALKGWQEAHPDDYIQVLVNNAGIRKDQIMVFMKPEEWHKVLNITLDGFYNVLKPLILPMVQARAGGRIVAISSISGVIGNRGQTNYSAAKAGLIGAAALILVTPENFTDWKSWGICAAAFVAAFWGNAHPILIIVISAALGILLY
mgnify:CR=1 FL=1